VRFAPGSIFPAHVHDGGEEFLVLEGTFSDDRGDYPAGTYVRNPPGSRHATSSREGCTLFVKLRQFAPGDEATVVMNTRTGTWQRGPGPGMEVLRLHGYAGEQVSLLRLAPNAVLETTGYAQGAEILVLSGMLTDGHGDHPTGTWLRYPPGSAHTPSSRAGCTFYVKRGHLA
jgi:anti-sigma factor ChrR (cupin superfamily)